MERTAVLQWLLLLAISQVSFAQVDYSQYVNPFIGGSGPFDGLAYGGGDIFVGAARPFGVAKVGIDTYEPNVSFAVINGGWTPKGYVTGISMMHESGTGGPSKYGIIPQMPLTSIKAPVNILDNQTYWQTRVGDDIAEVGYFKTQFENGVMVELSGSKHSGIMQYSFPEGKKHVLVDISHYLPSLLGSYSSQVFLGGEVHLDGQKYTGHGTYGGGWNEGAPYTVYFCGEFETEPVQARTFRGRNTDPPFMQRYHTFSNEPVGQATFGDNSSYTVTSGPLNDRIGAVFSWDDSAAIQVKSKVGISFMSVEKACYFKDNEIPTWSLNDTINAAVAEWNDVVFNKIQVPTDESVSNRTNLVLLYSSLYFMHLMPSDRTGENPLWDSGEPLWDDFYALWDTFRCTVSLYHIIQPEAYESQIRSLIDIWRWEGYMPDGRSGNWNGLVQGGSNADNVLADAYVKGLRGDINWTAGYLAMVKNAEVTPYNTFSPIDFSASVKEGRGALDDWKNLGYVSAESTRCISRTIEYALNDYALSVVAAGEAPKDVEKYLNRSAGWQRIWNRDVESLGFSGFLAPRRRDGEWNVTGYNPGLCGACEWTSISYEATPWEYSFTTPHDMRTLIEFMGGEGDFERRLDYIFQPNSSQQDLSSNGASITSIMNIGNEPDFATPYLYNYLNKQHKSVNQSRALANQYFHNALYGIPGNSDAGALNSWLIWQMLGLYPIVTQPVYLLESPWFSEINITVNTNATLRITSNGDSRTLGQNGYYLKEVKINGKVWGKNWFEHEDVMVKGGSIEFTVGEEPVAWETEEGPPSPGHWTI
ncbi:glycosyl hydrolase [Pseudomassariella vexata]|uniref:Glycosyl hydrolase n=1 Tax=Pseudomassariella vexata TaxID=1141098 RepID=A0A1Y2DZV4_9PEZI|nr:glycosyl hydrolase [Pseudomassariella vexata]ORY64820.1 glycosyl hydrolase [Pseudomassariella vexata]